MQNYTDRYKICKNWNKYIYNILINADIFLSRGEKIVFCFDSRKSTDIYYFFFTSLHYSSEHRQWSNFWAKYTFDEKMKPEWKTTVKIQNSKYEIKIREHYKIIRMIFIFKKAFVPWLLCGQLAVDLMTETKITSKLCETNGETSVLGTHSDENFFSTFDELHEFISNQP